MASETTGEAGHAAADAAHAAPEHVQGMPQLDFSTFPNQIFWLVVALVAIYLIVSKIALPRIGSVLEERHDVISDYVSQAADFKKQAEEAEAAYEAALKEARAEAQKIAGETKAAIQKDLDKAIVKADAEIAAKTAESAEAIAKIAAGAAENVKLVATEATAGIIAALLPAASDDAAIKTAITNRMKG